MLWPRRLPWNGAASRTSRGTGSWCACPTPTSKFRQQDSSNRTAGGRRLFPESVPQFAPGRVDLFLRVVAQQNGAELVALIVTARKFLLGVTSLYLDPARLDAEVAHKIHAQIEHLRPKIRYLLIFNAFL